MVQDTGSLVELVVGDEPDAWRSLGFAVADDATCRVGATGLRFAGPDAPRGRGVVGWTLAGVAVADGDLDGLRTAVVPDPGDAAPPVHPNGVTAVDHVVVITPDLDRTTAAIEAAGVRARRTRQAGRGRLQRFFRLGEVVVELVGPAEPSGTGPAAFWGLAFTVADIDAAAALLGDRIGDPKPAVQPGRRIATVRGGADVSVPVALMSAADGGPGAPGRGEDHSL